MVKRRDFITLLGGAAAWPLAARAQQGGKIYRIGFLANDPTIPTQPAGQAFLDGLRENGFIEGKNIVIERRFAEARLDRYPKLVAELIRLNVDVMVTSANAATLAAKRASTKIPRLSSFIAPHAPCYVPARIIRSRGIRLKCILKQEPAHDPPSCRIHH